MSPLPLKRRRLNNQQAPGDEMGGDRSHCYNNKDHHSSRYSNCDKAPAWFRRPRGEGGNNRGLDAERERNRDVDRSQYAYRSSDHLTNLRARRQENAGRHRPGKDTGGSSSRSQLNPRVAEHGPVLRQVSPSPSPPNAPTARFSERGPPPCPPSKPSTRAQKTKVARDQDPGRLRQVQNRDSNGSPRRSLTQPAAKLMPSLYHSLPEAFLSRLGLLLPSNHSLSTICLSKGVSNQHTH